MNEKNSENSESEKPIVSFRLYADWKDWLDEFVEKNRMTRQEYFEEAIKSKMIRDGCYKIDWLRGTYRSEERIKHGQQR